MIKSFIDYLSLSDFDHSAILTDINLVPRGDIVPELINDYKAMENMIYGNIPSFDEVMEYLHILQEEIHAL